MPDGYVSAAKKCSMAAILGEKKEFHELHMWIELYAQVWIDISNKEHH